MTTDMPKDDTRAQFLADEFNKKYYAAAHFDSAKLFQEASLLARQLVLELGHQKVLKDILLDPHYKVEMPVWCRDEEPNK